MNDEQLLRYSRQIMLPWMDVAGQQKLLDASVLIVGLGGLGAPVAMYLAAAGVGRLVLADGDKVDLSNLQRQVIHAMEDIESPKVASAAKRLQGINPDCELITLESDLDAAQLQEQVPQVDLVLDCCDNFDTRFAVNQACLEHKTPLVSGAVTGMAGQIAVFDFRQADSACYRCLYPDTGDDNQNCTATGVLAPLPGVIGSMQAIEAIKLITGHGEPLSNRLMQYDASTATWHTSKLGKDPACPVCNQSRG